MSKGGTWPIHRHSKLQRLINLWNHWLLSCPALFQSSIRLNLNAALDKLAKHLMCRSISLQPLLMLSDLHVDDGDSSQTKFQLYFMCYQHDTSLCCLALTAWRREDLSRFPLKVGLLKGASRSWQAFQSRFDSSHCVLELLCKMYTFTLYLRHACLAQLWVIFFFFQVPVERVCCCLVPSIVSGVHELCHLIWELFFPHPASTLHGASTVDVNFITAFVVFF